VTDTIDARAARIVDAHAKQNLVIEKNRTGYLHEFITPDERAVFVDRVKRLLSLRLITAYEEQNLFPVSFLDTLVGKVIFYLAALGLFGLLLSYLTSYLTGELDLVALLALWLLFLLAGIFIIVQGYRRPASPWDHHWPF
jgi:hypothetical protein